MHNHAPILIYKYLNILQHFIKFNIPLSFFSPKPCSSSFSECVGIMFFIISGLRFFPLNFRLFWKYATFNYKQITFIQTFIRSSAIWIWIILFSKERFSKNYLWKNFTESCQNWIQICFWTLNVLMVFQLFIVTGIRFFMQLIDWDWAKRFVLFKIVIKPQSYRQGVIYSFNLVTITVQIQTHIFMNFRRSQLFLLSKFIFLICTSFLYLIHSRIKFYHFE